MNEKIEAIYKEISNKELSFGCNYSQVVFWNKYYNKVDNKYKKWILTWEEIIWHDVMIWDVLDWKLKNWKNEFLTWIFHDTAYLWHFLRLPIEKQSEQCIDYVYNLIEIWNEKEV